MDNLTVLIGELNDLGMTGPGAGVGAVPRLVALVLALAKNEHIWRERRDASGVHITDEIAKLNRRITNLEEIATSAAEDADLPDDDADLPDDDADLPDDDDDDDDDDDPDPYCAGCINLTCRRDDLQNVVNAASQELDAADVPSVIGMDGPGPNQPLNLPARVKWLANRDPSYEKLAEITRDLERKLNAATCERDLVKARDVSLGEWLHNGITGREAIQLKDELEAKLDKLRDEHQRAKSSYNQEIDLLRMERDAMQVQHGQMAAERVDVAIDSRLRNARAQAARHAAALIARRDELLALVARISQSTPLPDELAGWESQRAAMVAEIGTLRASNAELRETIDSANRMGGVGRGHLEARNAEVDALKSEITFLNEAVNELRRELASVRDHRERLQVDLDAERAVTACLNDQIVTLVDRLTLANTIADKAQKELAEATSMKAHAAEVNGQVTIERERDQLLHDRELSKVLTAQLETHIKRLIEDNAKLAGELAVVRSCLRNANDAAIAAHLEIEKHQAKETP